MHMPCARYLDFGKDATLSSIRRVQERLLSTYSRHRAKQAQSAPVSIDPFDIANTHRRFDLDQREQRAMMRFLVVTHLESRCVGRGTIGGSLQSIFIKASTNLSAGLQRYFGVASRIVTS